MSQLKILGEGISDQALAQSRGKLFEDLMSTVLRSVGYEIGTLVHNVNYSGMEIDIEGKSHLTGIPLYAECKCYEHAVESPKFQQFVGKYTSRWFKDKKCQGLFIALPCLNSHAKGFFNDNCRTNSEIVVRLLEEEAVLEEIFTTKQAVRPEVIAENITNTMGHPGDSQLLYTDRGFFWIQHVTPSGSGIATQIGYFDARGKAITDTPTLEYLQLLYPDLKGFDTVPGVVGKVTGLQKSYSDGDTVVRVRGSSSCFEYQFPASPQFFLGRHHVTQEFDDYLENLSKGYTSSRGLLFEANSGWGKSSVVLNCAYRLIQKGHYSVAIDCRSAASTQFVLRVAEYVRNEFADFGGSVKYSGPDVGGFDGCIRTFMEISDGLRPLNKYLFVFFDQFENVFYLPDCLKRIVDLLLKLCDERANIVFCFSWKTDLISLANEFPYQLRDTIINCSNRIPLGTFSEVETTALLNELAQELGEPLRKDLRFFLSEFSQGYPWLLKRLCAHVKAQCQLDVPQAELVQGLLNVEDLFHEDLSGLTQQEENALRNIAKVAPVVISDLGEKFEASVVQTLVNRRLIVRIGNKYDIYWDIFRDYLNSGRVPIQENYILRVQVRSVLKTMRVLSESGGKLSTTTLRRRTNFTEKSFYNVTHDLRLLGLAFVDKGSVSAAIVLSHDEKEFEGELRNFLRDRMRRNRLVWQILQKLESNTEMPVSQVGNILAEACPYITASFATWDVYARLLATWMDFCDLALWNSDRKSLTLYQPSKEIRERQSFLSKVKKSGFYPQIQYSPLVDVSERLVNAIRKEGKGTDWWSGLTKSTLSKSLVTLELLGFVVRKPKSIEILPTTERFVAAPPNERRRLFSEAALKLGTFASFVEILTEHQNSWLSLSELSAQLKLKIQADWKISTGVIYVKIMLDWARHLSLAPGVFAISKRGRKSKT